MRPAASCSAPRVASVTERTSDCHICTLPAPPVSQSIPQNGPPPWGGGMHSEPEWPWTSLASLYPPDTPPVLASFWAASGVDIAVLAQLCLPGPYSKTVCPDARDPGVEGPAEPQSQGLLGARQPSVVLRVAGACSLLRDSEPSGGSPYSREARPEPARGPLRTQTGKWMLVIGYDSGDAYHS